MKTNAYAYNEAVRDVQKYKTAVTLSEVQAFCEADPESKNCPNLNAYNAHCPELDLSFTYNAQVVDDAIEKLKLEKNERTEKILSGLTYNTRSYNRANKTIEKYHQMLNDGWTPIHDITPDMAGEKAHMVGESSGIMGTTKIDMKVTLVHTGNEIGYMKPRQRTRYYIPAYESQSFIKVIK